MIRTPHANAMRPPSPAMMQPLAFRDGLAVPFGAAQALKLMLAAARAVAQGAQEGTAFTFQGRLADPSRPANGSYDLQFSLFPQASGGSRVGAVLAFPSTPVPNGLFNLSLDFGQGAFNGSERWVQILQEAMKDTATQRPPSP